MEVNEFVKATLLQVLDGIREAQNSEGGEDINAKLGRSDLGGNLINAGAYGTYTRIDFDVAISAQTTGKGGGNLKVFGVGVEGGAEHTTESANRIKFSVPVRIPDGDTTKSEEVIEAGTKKRAAVAAKRQKRSNNKPGYSRFGGS